MSDNVYEGWLLDSFIQSKGYILTKDNLKELQAHYYSLQYEELDKDEEKDIVTYKLSIPELGWTAKVKVV